MSLLQFARAGPASFISFFHCLVLTGALHLHSLELSASVPFFLCVLDDPRHDIIIIIIISCVFCFLLALVCLSERTNSAFSVPDSVRNKCRVDLCLSIDGYCQMRQGSRPWGSTGIPFPTGEAMRWPLRSYSCM